MRTKDFIKEHCIGTMCQDFNMGGRLSCLRRRGVRCRFRSQTLARNEDGRQSDKILRKAREERKEKMNADSIRTVGELIEALILVPPNTPLCGSNSNGHDEYDCEVRPFCIRRYFENVDDDVGVCYVGIDYKHPN